MAILSFTLNPDAISKLHDALVCLGKFSEAVSIEASNDKLVLTALNSSKSAYASFTLVGNKFFSKYQYRPARSAQSKEKFCCKIYNKALLSVFKGRVGDPSRERETAIERAEVSVEDDEGKAKSRFIIKIICRHGVIKTYRLTFEAIPPMHALFVKANANNTWSISSRTLREFVEHFGPGTEQLDIYSEDSRVSLTSYTEKIMSGNEILKQPLHTSIAIDTLEFAEFSVEELLHIVISVKDFKSIITHAGITSTIVKACYSRPASPMQLTYSDEGILSEFILMTIGEVRGNSTTPAPNPPRAGSKRPASRQPLDATTASKRATPAEMPPPPPRSASTLENSRNKDFRPSPPPPQPSIPSDALFMPRADDDNDKMWDPVNQDDDDEDMLLWGQAGGDNDATINSARTQQGPGTPGMDIYSNDMSREAMDLQLAPTQRLPPTQKLSQIKGMFDD